MRRASKRLIRDWVKEGKRADADFFHPWDSTGDTLSFMDERMAYRWRNVETGVQFIVMEPPSFWGLRSVQRSLHRLLSRNGLPVIYMQPRQINDAGIDIRSITILDQGRLPRDKTKGTDTLFTANVTARWSSRILRQGLFISGFDTNEPHGGYFLCEVDPTNNPRTLEAAYAALVPDAVKQAELYGREVRRQGDLYFIPMPDMEVPDVYDANVAIFQTNHIAEFITGQGQHRRHELGYVRGTIRHRPAGRRPDHRPIRLGETWHMVVKNLVPIEVREPLRDRFTGAVTRPRRTERNWT